MSSALSLPLHAGMPPLPLAMLWVSAWSPRCFRNAGSLSFAVGIWSPLAPWHAVHVDPKMSLPCAAASAPPAGAAAAGVARDAAAGAAEPPAAPAAAAAAGALGEAPLPPLGAMPACD